MKTEAGILTSTRHLPVNPRALKFVVIKQGAALIRYIQTMETIVLQKCQI